MTTVYLKLLSILSLLWSSIRTLLVEKRMEEVAIKNRLTAKYRNLTTKQPLRTAERTLRILLEIKRQIEVLIRNANC